MVINMEKKKDKNLDDLIPEIETDVQRCREQKGLIYAIDFYDKSYCGAWGKYCPNQRVSDKKADYCGKRC